MIQPDRPSDRQPFIRHFRLAPLALAISVLSLVGGYGLRAQSPAVSVNRGTPGLGRTGFLPEMDSRFNDKATERKREGTKILDELGTFQNAGDRLAFLPAGDKESYRVLENLALERVDRALDESRGQRQWLVSGVLTEFRGSNYLLITKAVIRLQEGDTAQGQ